jgi:hypothetical protein
LGWRCGARREVRFWEKVEGEAGELGVRKVTGVSCSDLMVASRPKCLSEPRRVLNSERSSLEAVYSEGQRDGWQVLVRQAACAALNVPEMPDCILVVLDRDCPLQSQVTRL